MVEYNTVKFCSLCKKRFVVTKNDRWKYYCSDCQAKINKKKKASLKQRI